jgi:2',3'-cyclic-nucleotide 2'-phosphodiesterase (5'-nucleotidase family)
MVAALNAAGVDVATLGNHEFDFGIDMRIQRTRAARWQWVVSKVGFIGRCLVSSEISPDRLTHVRLVDPMDAAAIYLPILKREGVKVIIAFTHLAFRDDRALAQRFPQIDLRIGDQVLDPNKTYSVAMTDYMLAGGDEHAMFVNQKVLVGPQAGGLIVTALEKFVADREIAPAVEGRITIVR